MQILTQFSITDLSAIRKCFGKLLLTDFANIQLQINLYAAKHNCDKNIIFNNNVQNNDVSVTSIGQHLFQLVSRFPVFWEKVTSLTKFLFPIVAVAYYTKLT